MQESIRLGVVMDPIQTINPKKDSTLAMLLAAGRRGWELRYMEQPDLFLRDGVAQASVRPLQVFDDLEAWFALGAPERIELAELDVILMRKDPPFDMHYINTTYVLERAAVHGAMVVNDPASLRDVNEKAYTAWFPELCPPTLITRSIAELRSFAAELESIVVKPLDGMGGRSIYVVQPGDLNKSVIFETLTEGGTRYAMAQRYVPEITRDGDKRILLIDGHPVAYTLARIPAPGESRGNLAAGARAEGRPLSERDRYISEQVGPVLAAKGLTFVGLDVIGEYLTEINVTSPTCIRELDREFGLDIAGDLMDSIASKLAARRATAND